MVYRIDGDDKALTGFVVKPNQAMSWRTQMYIYFGIAAITISIGVVFFVHGLTLILPFSGLEIMLLGIALYLTAWRSKIQEVISISETEIVIERGRKKPESRHVFQRPWTKLVLERSRNNWYPSRLLVRSHSEQVEIGQFLNEQERQGLAELLDQTLMKNTEN